MCDENQEHHDTLDYSKLTLDMSWINKLQLLEYEYRI